jgi:hypothetical protein
MSKSTRYLGLDVQAETITAAIADGRMRVRSLGEFPNRPEAVRRFIEKLGSPETLRVCWTALRTRVVHIDFLNRDSAKPRQIAVRICKQPTRCSVLDDRAILAHNYYIGRVRKEQNLVTDK